MIRFLCLLLLTRAVLCGNQLCKQAVAFSPSLYNIRVCRLENTADIAMKAKETTELPSPIFRVKVSGTVVSRDGFIIRPLIFDKRVVTGISQSLVHLKRCFENLNYFECGFVNKNNGFVVSGSDGYPGGGRKGKILKMITHITIVLVAGREKTGSSKEEFRFESINITYTHPSPCLLYTSPSPRDS